MNFRPKDFKQASKDFLQYTTGLNHLAKQVIPKVEKTLDPEKPSPNDGASKEQHAEMQLSEIQAAIKDVMAGYEDILKSIGML